MVYLHGTKWLGEVWGKRNIFFRLSLVETPVVTGTGQSVCIKVSDLDRPFFCRKYEDDPDAPGTMEMLYRIVVHVQTDKALFSLGILLIELWFGKPIEVLEKNFNIPTSFEQMKTTSYLIVDQLLNAIYDQAGSRYGNVVRNCIRGLDQYKKVKNHDYKKLVYKEVVSELGIDQEEYVVYREE
ncbi:hypothetical protein K440DRAFT_637776 [Wilcoxina mikolae CBS 423.85]|nr:hypothetical protein K440DRAFT_637776 [Wilcoxina mikolae CBS 423.85]